MLGRPHTCPVPPVQPTNPSKQRAGGLAPEPPSDDRRRCRPVSNPRICPPRNRIRPAEARETRHKAGCVFNITQVAAFVNPFSRVSDGKVYNKARSPGIPRRRALPPADAAGTGTVEPCPTDSGKPRARTCCSMRTTLSTGTSGAPEALHRRPPGRPPCLPVGRLRHLPLVPRHGARVVRGPGHRRVPQLALRQCQGRPGGAARRRPGLHGRRAGDDRPGRLADERVPHRRRRALSRRHLLPEGRPRPPPVVPPRAGGGGRRLVGATGRAARPGAEVDGSRGRPDPGRRRRPAGRRPRPGGRCLGGLVRPEPRRVRRCPQVPAGAQSRAGRAPARHGDAPIEPPSCERC